jgi:hypothetical protein
MRFAHSRASLNKPGADPLGSLAAGFLADGEERLRA